MALAVRTLTFTFKIGSTGVSETMTGLRASVQVTRGGYSSPPSASGQIYGMTADHMNQLSTMGRKYLPDPSMQNFIAIEAGEDGGPTSQVFSGPITDAFADYNQAPDNPFQFTAALGMDEKITPVPTNSFNGAVDVATVMQALATKMGRAFENSGVSVQITDPYLHGTLWYQAKQIAEAARINWHLDETTLAIWPENGSRGTLNLTVSPDSGLIGYPSYVSTGIFFEALFNPAFEFGKVVTIQSSLKPACGNWTIGQLTHSLSSEMPDGPWFSSIYGYPVL